MSRFRTDSEQDDKADYGRENQDGVDDAFKLLPHLPVYPLGPGFLSTPE